MKLATVFCALAIVLGSATSAQASPSSKADNATNDHVITVSGSAGSLTGLDLS